MANLTDLVFVCYLSARQGPSQVTATPQPICVITNTFYHFPDNVLHPLDPSPSTSPHLLASLHPPPTFAFHPFSPFVFYPPPHPALSLLSTLSDSPVYSLLKPLFPLFRYLILFLSSLLTPFPRCFLLFFLFLPTLTHSPALSSHQKVLDFDICLQEQ